MTYTIAAAIGVVGALVLDTVVLRTWLVRRKAFWTAYAIVLLFQLMVNGLLTGLRIVRYRPSAIIGWRIAYAPVEDLWFGFALATATLSLWVWLGRRGAQARRRAHRANPPLPDARGRR
ncbi:MAG TPA: lycopene cyclase domain-containing protein [Jatrophihabitans sp.]|nr:lycopene cyclase domain-containing protein [Jatrophihabitans sp.]